MTLFYDSYSIDGNFIGRVDDTLALPLEGWAVQPSPEEELPIEVTRRHSFMWIVDPKDLKQRRGYVVMVHVPDDKTGWAKESVIQTPDPNVQFVGDSAVLDSLPKIKQLSSTYAAKYMGTMRASGGDFTQFAMEVLAIVYNQSKEKGNS